jgi:hypothetical protein
MVLTLLGCFFLVQGRVVLAAAVVAVLVVLAQAAAA